MVFSADHNDHFSDFMSESLPTSSPTLRSGSFLNFGLFIDSLSFCSFPWAAKVAESRRSPTFVQIRLQQLLSEWLSSTDTSNFLQDLTTKGTDSIDAYRQQLNLGSNKSCSQEANYYRQQLSDPRLLTSKPSPTLPVPDGRVSKLLSPRTHSPMPNNKETDSYLSPNTRDPTSSSAQLDLSTKKLYYKKLHATLTERDSEKSITGSSPYKTKRKTKQSKGLADETAGSSSAKEKKLQSGRVTSESQTKKTSVKSVARKQKKASVLVSPKEIDDYESVEAPDSTFVKFTEETPTREPNTDDARLQKAMKILMQRKKLVAEIEEMTQNDISEKAAISELPASLDSFGNTTPQPYMMRKENLEDFIDDEDLDEQKAIQESMKENFPPSEAEIEQVDQEISESPDQQQITIYLEESQEELPDVQDIEAVEDNADIIEEPSAESTKEIPDDDLQKTIIQNDAEQFFTYKDDAGKELLEQTPDELNDTTEYQSVNQLLIPTAPVEETSDEIAIPPQLEDSDQRPINYSILQVEAPVRDSFHDRSTCDKSPDIQDPVLLKKQDTGIDELIAARIKDDVCTVEDKVSYLMSYEDQEDSQLYAQGLISFEDRFKVIDQKIKCDILGIPYSPSRIDPLARQKIHELFTNLETPDRMNLEEFKERFIVGLLKQSQFLSTPVFTRLCPANATTIDEEILVAHWDGRFMLDQDTLNFFQLIRSEPNDSIAADDFRPFIKAVIDDHIAFDFLRASRNFEGKYITTVITRMMYSLDIDQKGQVSLLDLYREEEQLQLHSVQCDDIPFIPHSFPAVWRLLDYIGDINLERKYFSYEHFYVIYCTFFELDSDRDSFIDKEDLLKYDQHALGSCAINRIFSVIKQNSSDENSGTLMSYEDYIVFLINEENKTTDQSLEFWFNVVDLDNDGYIRYDEMLYFYSEQHQRLQTLNYDAPLLSDIICQLVDMIEPECPDFFSLEDLKKKKDISGILFDSLLSLTKLLSFEQKDPFSIKQELQEYPHLTPFDRFCRKEYEHIVFSIASETNAFDENTQLEKDAFDSDNLYDKSSDLFIRGSESEENINLP